MLLRSLCARVLSGTVLVFCATGGDLLAQQRPSLVDELPGYSSVDMVFQRNTQFQSLFDSSSYSSSQIQPVVSNESTTLLPETTTTTYASVEVPAPAPAVEEDVNLTTNAMVLERLMAVEAKLASLRSESLVKNVEEKAKKPTYKLGGRIHLDHWTFPQDSAGIGYFEHSNPANSNYGTDPEDRWAFRRVRIELSGENPANMYWRFQIDFAKAEVSEFKDVYIGWKGFPANQQIQIGNQKRPIGLDAWNSSRFNVFMERPFIIEAVNADARRIGLATWGHSDEEDIFWQYGVYHAENVSDDGVIIGDAWQPSLNGRIGGSPWYQDDANWVHWALAGQIVWPDSRPDPNNISTDQNEFRLASRPEARTTSRWLDTGRVDGVTHGNAIGLEGMYNRGPFNLTSEAFYMQANRTAGFGPSLDFGGCYVQGSMFLNGSSYMKYKRRAGSLDRPHIDPFFAPCDECSPSLGVFQLALRYSYADISSNDILGGVGESVTLGVNWWFSNYSRIQFNVINGSIRDHAPIAGYTAGNYTIIGTRYAINF